MVAEADKVLTISTLALLLPRESIRNAANILGFDIQEQHELAKTDKTVWVLDNKKFIEKKIKLGITDDAYHEILEGVTSDDKVLTDVEEKDQLEALYKKMMGKL